MYDKSTYTRELQVEEQHERGSQGHVTRQHNRLLATECCPQVSPRPECACLGGRLPFMLFSYAFALTAWRSVRDRRTSPLPRSRFRRIGVYSWLCCRRDAPPRTRVGLCLDRSITALGVQRGLADGFRCIYDCRPSRGDTFPSARGRLYH